MTLKSILFGLFLYVSSVWVGAAYWYSGPKIQDFGLFWTAAGLIGILLIFVISKLWKWALALRSRASLKPKRVAAPKQVISEEESAIRALIADANATLSRSITYAESSEKVSITDLPCYLVVGPEGCGKTSTLLNSGLEPQLLAGETSGLASGLPTRLCNFWLAKDAVFIEVGGSVFNGDLERWQRVLKALKAKPQQPSWQKLWSRPPRILNLHGVVACCDVKTFMLATSPQARERLDTQCREWQERLGAVSESFGIGTPFYVLITKLDAVSYFGDFFRRVSDPEAAQVLGSALVEAGDANRSIEADAKRLTKTFNTLYHNLAERRINQLACEPDSSLRPGVYEFPRELKRIRPALVQFLSTVFRSNPLRPTPLLRGYYFSAIGERQMSVAVAANSGMRWIDQSSFLEATGLFRGDATEIFRPHGERAKTDSPASSRSAEKRWMFVPEFFEKVLPDQGSPVIVTRLEPKMERLQRITCGAVCAISLLLCVLLVRSWFANVQLLHEAVVDAGTLYENGLVSASDLQSLENLRVQAGRLFSYEHDGAPFRLRWGLYAGDRIAPNVKDVYFRRFQRLILNGANENILSRLEALPATPGPEAPYNPPLRLLKAHLMIASAAQCELDPSLVAEQVKANLQPSVVKGMGSTQRQLAEKQVDFYANELIYENPCRVPVNAAARDHARAYLSKIQGADRIYTGILALAGKALTNRPQRLRDLSPNYAEVFNGPGEMDGVYTKSGWTFVENESKKSSGANTADACALGGTSRFHDGEVQSAETTKAIRQLFLRDYQERWRRYLQAFSFKGYTSPGDAARKLELLSGHKSPLLALMALTSGQTTFPAQTEQPQGFDRVAPAVKNLFPGLSKIDKNGAASTSARTVSSEADGNPVQITRAFQPVHIVVPAGSDTWVVDKNSAYVDALAQLGHAMQEVVRASETEQVAGAAQSASQSYDKALDAARQLARGFEPVGTDGLDVTIERLLETPIKQTQRFIVTNPEARGAEKPNADLKILAGKVTPTLRKYPFRPSHDEAGLEEVSALFAPVSGAVWKFQAESLHDLVTRDGSHWISKDPGKKPQVSPDLLAFLNHAQAITDAMYPGGASQPQFNYTLRPKPDPSYRDAVMEVEIDGQAHAWTSSLQKQFSWPGSADGRTGAVGRIRSGSLSFPFASRGGVWGIFRVMGDAEPRALGSKLVEWKYLRGGDGRREAIQPAPVRLEIVEFPGGVDVFNPKFFEGLQCPLKAVL